MRIAITGSHGVGKTTLINDLLKFLNKKEETMKAGITGSHGTGKTTLSKHIAGRNNYKLLPESPRQALQLGFPINENTPIETEFWIFGKQLEMEMIAGDNYIADKCFIDLLAYAICIFGNNLEFIKVLREITERAVRKYDVVIYLPSGEFPIEDDGVRSTDPKFQAKIDELIVEILHDFNIKYTRITGGKEERYQKALKAIKSN
ncbi:AAA family ATPase [Patescibacteria group bacterium]|nr:AAA family ATPase [Candidatus Falkowbacteria bacterium]MBU3905911.1 AAA family ATPase [Patescibacteria group bacterium]MBU4015443.1 AAA family ATPase [Patescibacteria group bacterium]MBU4026702.1 AAA family ATPase [Patescibacteria group bacterium]MBU4072975.1 AAA family ATPase [Patescibacteria group bacterium]